jgi:hypothetical protein
MKNLMFALFALFAFLAAARICYADSLVVSFQGITSNASTRIRSFDIRIKNGRILGLLSIPKDWEINLSNDGYDSATLTGGNIHDGSAVKQIFFSRFLKIDRIDKNVPATIKVKLWTVRSTPSELEIIKIVLTEKQILLESE